MSSGPGKRRLRPPSAARSVQSSTFMLFPLKMTKNSHIYKWYSPFATFAPRLAIYFLIIFLGNAVSLPVPLPLTLLPKRVEMGKLQLDREQSVAKSLMWMLIAHCDQISCAPYLVILLNETISKHLYRVTQKKCPRRILSSNMFLKSNFTFPGEFWNEHFGYVSSQRPNYTHSES